MPGDKMVRFSVRGLQLAHHLAGAAHRSAIVARSRVASGISAAGKMRRAALELVFPGSCVSCRAEVNPDEANRPTLPLCGDCLDQLELFSGPTCSRCGAPVPKLPGGDSEGFTRPKKDDDCFRCRGRKLWFDETLAAGLYSGRLRELLLRMKQAEGDLLSLAVGQLIWEQCGERLRALGADVVVPIPLHWRRRLAHRTNSAAVLAEVLASRLRLPLATGLLRRRRHTHRQFDLTPPQRWDNVRHAFSVRSGYHLNEARVLLVDDILTTGATCSEAARALRKAGARRVSVTVAARAVS